LRGSSSTTGELIRQDRFTSRINFKEQDFYRNIGVFLYCKTPTKIGGFIMSDFGDKVKVVLAVGTCVAVLGFGGYALVGSVVGQIGSNHEVIDLKKNFNVIIEKTPNTVSVVKVNSFTDYQGNTVEFETSDGLRVITTIEEATLSNAASYGQAMKLATTYAKAKKYGVISYDQLQGNGTELSRGSWNKKVMNFNYSFDKAVEMQEDGSVIVYDVNSWKDWSDDDKVQFVILDGQPMLSTYKHIKLIDTSKAKEGALDNYLLSLTGDPELIIRYDDIKGKTSSNNDNNAKVKTLGTMQTNKRDMV
jgi:hypothetical protein